jgi:type I restriction enzyme S subunit
MELKPGYKLTEVGVIPEDWDAKSLESLVTLLTNGFVGTATKSYTNTDEGILYIQGYNVQENGFNLHGIKRVSREFAARNKKSCLQIGDLLTIQTGDIGTTTIVPPELAGANCHALIITRFKRKASEPGYYCQYFNSAQGRSAFKQIETGTTMKHLNGGDMKRLLVPCPPAEEQHAIATTLSGIDAYIAELDLLVTKKQGVKQATMQELLTGKRRLPGFEGEWEVKRLGDVISDLEAGVSVVSLQGNDQPSTGRFVLKTSAVTNGQLITSESKEITPSDLTRAKTWVKKDDLIISRMNTPALVGECGYSDSDYPHLFLPDRLWRVSYRNPATVSSRWLAYLLSFDQNKARIKELATGTSGSMKNISKHALLSLSIQWPTLAEQLAIAQCLSSLNDELKALSSRLEKTRALKQAMMQELLTGRIRLA